MKNKRYTIGFLFGDFYGAYTANLFPHIIQACRNYDQNIIGFGGGFLKVQVDLFQVKIVILFLICLIRRILME